MTYGEKRGRTTPTFAELYCARHGGTPVSFRRTLFWRTLHWHAVFFAPLLLLGDYFYSDYSLIDACASATRMDQVREQIRDYPYLHENRGWLRRHARIRISTRRLGRIAEAHLGERSARRAEVSAGDGARSAGG